MISFLTDYFNYAVVVILMMTGLYTIFASRNKIKQLVGLSVFQTSVFLFYITLAKVEGGQPPILVPDPGADADKGYAALEAAKVAAVDFIPAGRDIVDYSNPLPHVLILTAIVVGVATLAIGLALVVRIREVYGTVEDDDIDRIDYVFNLEGTDEPDTVPESNPT